MLELKMNKKLFIILGIFSLLVLVGCDRTKYIYEEEVDFKIGYCDECRKPVRIYYDDGDLVCTDETGRTWLCWDKGNHIPFNNPTTTLNERCGEKEIRDIEKNYYDDIKNNLYSNCLLIITDRLEPDIPEEYDYKFSKEDFFPIRTLDFKTDEIKGYDGYVWKYWVVCK